MCLYWSSIWMGKDMVVFIMKCWALGFLWRTATTWLFQWLSSTFRGWLSNSLVSLKSWFQRLTGLCNCQLTLSDPPRNTHAPVKCWIQQKIAFSVFWVYISCLFCIEYGKQSNNLSKKVSIHQRTSLIADFKPTTMPFILTSLAWHFGIILIDLI